MLVEEAAAATGGVARDYAGVDCQRGVVQNASACKGVVAVSGNGAVADGRRSIEVVVNAAAIEIETILGISRDGAAADRERPLVVNPVAGVAGDVNVDP